MKDKRDYELEFARLLHSKRSSSNKSPEIISSIIGVALGTLTTWENSGNLIQPSLYRADKIAEAYGIDPVLVKDLLEKAHEQRNQRREARKTLKHTYKKPKRRLVESPTPVVFRG
jgi:transcriptional regulator with XRE-family HTH domain